MSFSLADKLYAEKQYEDIMEVLGRKFKFRALGQSDELEIARVTSASTFIEYTEARKVPTLARAIVNIDGQPLAEADEVKQLLRSEKSGMTPVQAVERILATNPAYTSQVIDAIYVAYAGFRAKYFTYLIGLKKNSDQAKAEPSGSSAKA